MLSFCLLLRRFATHSRSVAVVLAAFSALCSPALAQTMGASSSSTGSVSIPINTTGIGRTNYGSKSLNVINQSSSPAGGFVAPSTTFNLPEIPAATPPAQPLRTPRPYQPDLGPFEPNR